MLLAVDESLGRLIGTLEELKQIDNTVIVFTSDNGYFYGEHGLSEERRLAYEESIRIPLLVRYPPAVPAGVTAPAPCPSTTRARGRETRTWWTRASPSGVATTIWSIGPPGQNSASSGSAAMGSTSSGPLLRTAFTAVDTG